MKRTKPSIQINGFAILTKHEYKKVRKILNTGWFHTSETMQGFKIKIIDDDVRQAVLKVM